MTASSIAYLMGALLLFRGALGRRVDATYSCPTCGTNRADAHSASCPWSRRP